jgi:hypothetical protein
MPMYGERLAAATTTDMALAAITGGYAAGGYPGFDSGYANRSYVTGRSTLFPRYYGANW